MKDKSAKPPYTSYRSFDNLIKELRDHSVLPGVIDRSFLSKRSGSEQSALIATLKWFGLIDDAGAPQKLLVDFVAADEDTAKAMLKEMVVSAYALVTDGTFNLHSATTSMMADQFRQYEISGSTLTKSVSFFLAAAKEANIQVSPHVKPPASSNNGSTKKKAKASPPAPQWPPRDQGNSLSGDKPPASPRKEMIAIPIPIYGGADGVIYLPGNMTSKQWTSVIKMTEFILQNYRETMAADSDAEGTEGDTP